MPDTPTPAAAAPISVSSSPHRRIASVDALRGFDMFWIIGADSLFYAVNKLGGGNPLVSGIARQLDHVSWAGLRFYDLIFPLFVFIVGVSIVLSMSRRTAGAGPAAALPQILRRFVILFLLGLFTYSGIDNGVDNIRLLGVLQRIAICYLVGSIAFLYLKPRGLVILCASLLIGYWAAMTFIPVPGIGAGNFEEGKNLANYVDLKHLPLRRWDGTHDPEGILSTLPAIASCLLGIFAGMLLRNDRVPDLRKVKLLAAYGAAGIVLGFLWSLQFPIIKKIWTSSFVLAAGGFSALFLAAFYLVIDVWKKDRWAVPFFWIGTNAIAVYMLVHVVSLEKMAARLVGGEIKISLDYFREGLGDLLIALVALAFAILFCRFLYNRKIFLKV